MVLPKTNKLWTRTIVSRCERDLQMDCNSQNVKFCNALDKLSEGSIILIFWREDCIWYCGKYKTVEKEGSKFSVSIYYFEGTVKKLTILLLQDCSQQKLRITIPLSLESFYGNRKQEISIAQTWKDSQNEKDPSSGAPAISITSRFRVDGDYILRLRISGNKVTYDCCIPGEVIETLPNLLSVTANTKMFYGSLI